VRKQLLTGLLLLVAFLIALASWQMATAVWRGVVAYESPYQFAIQAGPASQQLNSRVVLIVIDGLTYPMSEDMPTLLNLRANGAGFRATVSEPTLSLPSWTTILTGTTPEVHGVTTNWTAGPAQVTTLTSLARDRGLTTALVGGAKWRELCGNTVTEGYHDLPAGDDDVTRRALQLVTRAAPPNLTILHYSRLDDVGHARGTASLEYLESALAIDRDIDSIYHAAAGKDCTFVIVSDHGHVRRGGHGGVEPEVSEVPLVLRGRAILPGVYGTAALTDVAPTVAALLGLPFPMQSTGMVLMSALDVSERQAVSLGNGVTRGWYEFYSRYLRLLGGGAMGNVTSAQAANYSSFAEQAKSLTRMKDEVRRVTTVRLWSDRLARLSLVLPLGFLIGYYVWSMWRDYLLRRCLVVAACHMALTESVFRLQGLSYSLSSFNPANPTRLTDAALVRGFITARAGETFLLAALVVFVMAWWAANDRRASPSDVLVITGHTTLTVMLAHLLPAYGFMFLWGAGPNWYLPPIGWGVHAVISLVRVIAIGLGFPLFLAIGPIIRALIYRPRGVRGAAAGPPGLKPSI
jgi:hypothetical protein